MITLPDLVAQKLVRWQVRVAEVVPHLLDHSQLEVVEGFHCLLWRWRLALRSPRSEVTHLLFVAPIPPPPTTDRKLLHGR